MWVESAKDGASFEKSKFIAQRDANDIPLASELIIDIFFKSIRDNIGEDVLTRDEEILLVLECMKSSMSGTEDELAKTLSQYLGVRV